MPRGKASEVADGGRCKRQTYPIRIPVRLSRELTAAAGSLWLAMDGGSTARIDPASRRVTARIPIRAYGAIAVGAGAAWAADAQVDVVYRIDPHASD